MINHAQEFGVSVLLVALSGRVASGKTTLGERLVKRRPGVRFGTSTLLQQIAQRHGRTLVGRRALQEFGDEVDNDTAGWWIANELIGHVVGLPGGSLVVVDAVRMVRQIQALRRAFDCEVTHVHLTAPVAVLADRYANRWSDLEELPDYAEVGANATEAAVEALADYADVVIDTSCNTPAEVEVQSTARLDLP